MLPRGTHLTTQEYAPRSSTIRAVPLVMLAWLAQSTPQNPSPMSDSTRSHPRVERYDPPGRRWPLPTGTLYVREGFTPSARVRLIVHFHGAPWLVEHHVYRRRADVALVTIQIGSGSRAYAEAFADPSRFSQMLDEATARLSEIAGRRVSLDRLTLSSFSAGYGAIRSILQQPQQYARVDEVVLADSLHASYAGEVTPTRAADLAVDETSLDPFIRFAAEAAAGRKTMRVMHSEVFPGTYASTTETADVLLRRLNLTRRRVLRDGPLGMQQLSEARAGNLYLAGFAGNSAPDHMDHLYVLDAWLFDGRRPRSRHRAATGRAMPSRFARICFAAAQSMRSAAPASTARLCSNAIGAPPFRYTSGCAST
jgi:hypothetical protein